MKYTIDDIHARTKVKGECPKTWDRLHLFPLCF